MYYEFILRLFVFKLNTYVIAYEAYNDQLPSKQTATFCKKTKLSYYDI